MSLLYSPLPLLHQMPVASIAPSSNRLSCDPEEELRRQEKWQKEQERLLQVTVCGGFVCLKCVCVHIVNYSRGLFMEVER